MSRKSASLVDMILDRKRPREDEKREIEPEGNYGYDEDDSDSDDEYHGMAKEMIECFHAKDHEGLATMLRGLKGK